MPCLVHFLHLGWIKVDSCSHCNQIAMRFIWSWIKTTFQRWIQMHKTLHVWEQHKAQVGTGNVRFSEHAIWIVRTWPGSSSSLTVFAYDQLHELLLVHHVFVLENVVHFSCSSWTLKFLPIQHLLLKLFDWLKMSRAHNFPIRQYPTKVTNN